ncbi:sporulation protein [Spartinivicinus ruber]|uniref:sporulation protein n=1 Tax=Spartinivicinus ruber TaxID=2683272 RepID=UPI0013D4208E|nr:sporulation protein [Spartinivicinus ruber]
MSLASLYACRVWIKTGLEIDLGVGASDKDYLTIKPTAAMKNFLQAMDECGYYLYKADGLP